MRKDREEKTNVAARQVALFETVAAILDSPSCLFSFGSLGFGHGRIEKWNYNRD